MHVILLNESSKKALVRSRRVLSKYLPQLGSNTWAGAISEEGLGDLRLALKAAGASKNTAVSCLRLEGRGRLEPVWTVGSTAQFDSAGRYAFRQTQARRVLQVPVHLSPLERYTGALLKLSGLAHDTGKASKAFADKLKRGSGAEAIRHELLSFLMVAESLWTPDVSDEAWLQRLQDRPQDLAACVGVDSTTGRKQLLPSSSPLLCTVLEALRARTRAPEPGADDEDSHVETRSRMLDGSQVADLFERAPGLATLLWQVLAHHRLPAGDETAQSWWSGMHINAPSPESAEFIVADVTACLTPANGLTPWEDPSWLKAVAATAKSALAALRELNGSASNALTVSGWAVLNAHYLRPALILADHLGSQRAQKSFKKSDTRAAGQVFANTLGNEYYGDTLATHELAVGRLTRQVTAMYAKRWPTTQLPDTSLSVTRNLKPPFTWQLELEDACVAARERGPVFASIIAETGAGKTLGGLRAANALNRGQLRLTLALGLRSLTWQSAQSMRDDAGLDASALVVAVGNPQTLTLTDQAKALAEEKAPASERARFGSDSAEGEDADLSLPTAPVLSDLSWLEGFCSEKEAPHLWGQKTLAMLDAPVLACTADYLTSSATMLRGGDAKLYLRLASSDLLLDEIDAYSPVDLQTIGKLALISGLHGRNVIVMSATMSPAVQEGLYRAWAHGLDVRARLKNVSAAHACVFSANTVRSVALPVSSGQLPAKPWLDFVQDVAAAYQAATAAAPRRVLEVVALEDGAKGAKVFEPIVQAAIKLHVSNHELDALTGVRVSTGFVRMNTAREAWNLAKYLAQRDSGDGPDVRFVAYHSKFPRTYLGVLDSVLGALTRRKVAGQWLNVPELRLALQATAKKDLLVIVCTTTLMETGRDFDFDWCVLEPRSVRGEVQACGRVLRHRPGRVAIAPNVAMLSTTLKGLDRENKSYWSKPGIEDSFKGLRVTEQLPLLKPRSAGAPPPSRKVARNVRTAAEALPLAAWARGLDASLCLLPAEDYAASRIGYLEQVAQALNLTSAAADIKPLSLTGYRTSLAGLNNQHAKETPFRGHKSQQLTFIPHAGKITFFDEAEIKARRAPVRRPVSISAQWLPNSEAPAANALIPDLAERANALFTGTDHHIDGCALRCPWHKGSDKALAWHPLLGFQEKTNSA